MQRLEQIARIVAASSVASFLMFLAAAWTGLLPNAVQNILGKPLLAALFVSVAFYIACFAYKFGSFESKNVYVERLEDRREREYLILGSLMPWRKTQASGMFLWAALIVTIGLALVGSLVSDELATTGLAVGATLSVLAGLIFLYWIVRYLSARGKIWLKLGHAKWELIAYACLLPALAVLAGLARYTYHEKRIPVAALCLIGLIVLRLRMLAERLW
jgi:hypothetical protein